ncbi:MAG TPA: hypothetical protein DDZ40_03410 [Deltaproteobacteria bacterium]|nr:hypothetical protein [Deltaproteobacteria bacterium]
MQVMIKVIVSTGIILAATAIARRFPSAAGLIGVMPLTGALVLAWVYRENKGDPAIMQGFAKGALWGIIPSIVFFLVAFFCLRKGFSLSTVLAGSFGAWIAAAAVHQLVFR